jgi:hypothetical protein
MSLKILSAVFLLLISLHATPCENPAVADDNLSKSFHYGCFCGENYPEIKHSSKKNYKELNTTARQELIEQYQTVDAYDDIDEACKIHDICFIEHGKEARVCNDSIVEDLTTIKEKFAKEADENITNAQCRDLAFDIGSVFHTIFSPADDEDTIFDFGMLMFNGAITATNKLGQEAADTLSDNAPRYPAKGVKCLLQNLGKIKKKKAPAPQKERTNEEPSFTLDI